MRNRYTIFIASLTIFILLSGLAYLTIILEQTYRERIHKDLELYTDLLIPALEMSLRDGDMVKMQELYEHMRESGNSLIPRVTIFSEDGTPVFDTSFDYKTMENHADRPEFQELIQTGASSVQYTRYSTSMKQVMLYSIARVEVKGKMFFLRTATTKNNMEIRAALFKRNLFYVLIMCLLISIVVIYGFYSWMKQSAINLQIEAQALIDRGGDEDLTVPSIGPLREVAQFMGSMSKKLRQQLYNYSKEKYIRDMIFASLTEGVILLDENFTIKDLNGSAAKMLGVSYNKALNKSVFAVWRREGIPEFIQADRDCISCEMEIPNQDKKIWVFLRKHIIDFGKAPGMLLVLYDLTPIKQLEQYRRDFVANVSHEIKTPLTVITGIVEALQDEQNCTPEQRRIFLDSMASNSKRLQELLKDILNLSNLEHFNLVDTKEFSEQSLDNTALIAIAMCRSMADEKKQTLVLEDKTGGKMYSIVQPMIEQALTNLIGNAIKYSSENDTIIIRLENCAENELKISVIDHGPGIPPEDVPHIFERFYRVERSRNSTTGGTGLGLAIVKQIAQIHGGNASVESEPGNGSMFFFTVKR